MRLLYITSELPFPLDTGLLRHYHFLQGLGRRHSITFLSLTERSAVPQETVAALSRHVREMRTFGPLGEHSSWAMRLLAGLPCIGEAAARLLRQRRAVRQMNDHIKRQLAGNDYDVILLTGKRTLPALSGVHGVPIVVDCCDATSIRVAGEMRHVGRGKWLALLLRYLQAKIIEARLARRTPYLLFASRRDRMAYGCANGVIIPSGVDPDFWSPGWRRSRPNRLVFVGVMNYSPNHDAAMFLIEEILPIVENSFGRVEVTIVGRDPRPELLARVKSLENVAVTGHVDDVRPYLGEATLFIAPIRYASGVQNKILQAMSMEVPVVTTSVVARGLEVAEEHPPLRTGDSAAAIAEQIAALLRDSEQRECLAAAGRRFVSRFFTWAENVEKLEALCLAAARRGTRPEDIAAGVAGEVGA